MGSTVTTPTTTTVFVNARPDSNVSGFSAHNSYRLAYGLSTRPTVDELLRMMNEYRIKPIQHVRAADVGPPMDLRATLSDGQIVWVGDG